MESVIGNFNALKVKLRDWSKNELSSIHRRKKILIFRIKGIEDAIAQRYSTSLRDLELALKEELKNVLDHEESLWYQKSRCNWFLNGDRNTKFYHAYAKRRQRVNYISSLRMDNRNGALIRTGLLLDLQFISSCGVVAQKVHFVGPHPKISSPENFTQFRPISLCNVMFKTIIKEVIHSMKSKKGQKGWMIIKFDLEKAYDCLEWNFIDDTLMDVGFRILLNGGKHELLHLQGVFGKETLYLCISLFSARSVCRSIDGAAGGYSAGFKEFCCSSGHRISTRKMSIYFSNNVAEQVIEDISSGFQYTRVENLGKYLGVPLLHNRVTKSTYQYIVQKVQDRLSGWQASVCKEIEKLIRRFIWSGSDEKQKVHLVSWDELCKPTDNGGMGFKKLQIQNEAFLMKISFRLLSEKRHLWARVLTGYGGKWGLDTGDSRLTLPEYGTSSFRGLPRMKLHLGFGSNQADNSLLHVKLRSNWSSRNQSIVAALLQADRWDMAPCVRHS
ncbi:uncharacterized protein LOC120165108 [Hibiscus syriacus]|uniref:uncharacterized protein LOC120165108 n=1 Tax=Hibiscus syriacus TaxID=106335 RepID=UPI001921ABAE|nr:uncharacterized protein LOC120165108 [Hibiscus syriacus]